MRRITVITLALALLGAALPGQALAHRPDRGADIQTSVECFELASPAGSAAVFVGVSETFGAFAQVAFWAAGSEPFAEPPTWIGGGDIVDLGPEGSLTATVDMYAPTETDAGQLIGTATITAVLVSAGDPEPFSFTERQGNRRAVFEGVYQPLTVSGNLSLPQDIAFDIAGCDAATQTSRQFFTNPDAFVFHARQVQLFCTWETGDASLSLFATADEFGSFADLYVADATGEYGGGGEASLTTDRFAATADLFQMDWDGSETASGSMSASAVLSPTGERIHDRFAFEREKVHTTGVELAVNGTLSVSLPAGDATYPMDASSCSAADLKSSQIGTTQNGPKPKPLANDLPQNAAPIASGEAVSVATGGTAVAPEAPCVFEDAETGEAFELPFGHTAWWSVAGTGDVVTVDTAGSSFDTVLAVYVPGEAGLEQVACVDDVETLQAWVALATEPGTEYLVQAGGFGESAGTLELRVD